MATIEKPTTRTDPATYTTPLPTDSYYDAPAPEGAGWLLFSAIALGFAGFWAFFEGLLAIGSSRIYVANATFVFSNLQTWGWIVMAARHRGDVRGLRDLRRQRVRPLVRHPDRRA